eukprot:303896_1
MFAGQSYDRQYFNDEDTNPKYHMVFNDDDDEAKDVIQIDDDGADNDIDNDIDKPLKRKNKLNVSESLDYYRKLKSLHRQGVYVGEMSQSAVRVPSFEQFVSEQLRKEFHG